MRIFIVEDEDLAIEGLTRLIQKQCPQCVVAGTADSVREAVLWLNTHPAPDLAFFDIHLADGLSFDIFQQIDIRFPVVFTTAYDAYALRAFEVNSIDYLLKPVSDDALERAFQKWKWLRGMPQSSVPALDINAIRQMLARATPRYKNRFMVKTGDHLATFTTDEIDYFWGENKIVWMRLKTGRKYPVDYTLEELEDLLDPENFYRLNRSYIVTFGAIKDVVAWSNSRLKIVLKEAPDHEDIMVSREKAEDFRVWMGK